MPAAPRVFKIDLNCIKHVYYPPVPVRLPFLWEIYGSKVWNLSRYTKMSYQYLRKGKIVPNSQWGNRDFCMLTMFSGWDTTFKSVAEYRHCSRCSGPSLIPSRPLYIQVLWIAAPISGVIFPRRIRKPLTEIVSLSSTSIPYRPSHFWFQLLNCRLSSWASHSKYWCHGSVQKMSDEKSSISMVSCSS